MIIKIFLILLGYTKDKNNKLKEEHINYYDEKLAEKDLNIEDEKVLICHSFFEYFKNQSDYKKAGSYLKKRK